MKGKRTENILSLLSESDFLLIQLRYFKGYSINRVCELLDVIATTFNNRRKTIILKKIMPLLV